MFRLSPTPLETERAQMAHSSAGGYVTFEGWVRDHNEGKTVLTLEYEAFEILANKEGERILAEARQRFDIIDAHCLHRTGKLQIGEMAVWIGVTAAHRGAAFEACEYIINQIKYRVPIWKKETYNDGDSGWVNCHHCHAAGKPALNENAFYDRQMLLPEIGPEGQQRLKNTSVLVVGAGGLGSAALQTLAAAGIGTLAICEPDRVEISNLHRQFLYRADDISQLKTEAAANHLHALNPFIQIITHPLRLDLQNAETLLDPYDWVLDCTDNFEARYALNDAAVATHKPLIQTSIYQYEGQMSVYLPHENSACLRCLWPKSPEPGAIGNCAVTGVLGATANIFGTLQALELIKQVLNLPGKLNGQEWWTVDLLSHATHRFRHVKNPACPTCGSTETAANTEKASAERFSTEWIIDVSRCGAEALSQYCLLDIGEDPDKALASSGLAYRHMPYSRFHAEKHALKLAKSRQYLLVCPYGGLSLYLTKMLRRQGAQNIYSLAGGATALENWRAQTGVR